MKARIKKKAWKKRAEFKKLPPKMRDYVVKRLTKVPLNVISGELDPEAIMELQDAWNKMIKTSKKSFRTPIMGTGKYILDKDHKIVECDDVMEWAPWFECDANRRVGHDTVGDVNISTVFLGIGMPDQLFETMIFDNGKDIGHTRCRTWNEAKEHHEKMVKYYERNLKTKRESVLEAIKIKKQFSKNFLPELKKL